MLNDTIPYITNTYQYMAKMQLILSRTCKALQKSGKNIIGFHVGPKTFFFVTGQQNVQTLFRSSPNIGFEHFFIMVLKNLIGASPEDVYKFERALHQRSRSTSKELSATSTEDGQEDPRKYFEGYHNILTKYLSASPQVSILLAAYQRLLSEQLDQERFPAGNWVNDVSIVDFTKGDIARAIITSILGTKGFEIAPDMMDLFWEYDKVLGTILYGPPRWLFRRVYRTRERYFEAMKSVFQTTTGEFDWSVGSGTDDGKEEVKADKWEPIMGSPFWREFSWWMIDSDFSAQTCAGFAGALLIRTTANTIPMITWGFMYMIRDPALFLAVRQGAAPALLSGGREFDIQKLASIPLLQSIYVEVMRLHVSVNITREVLQPLEVEGGYVLPLGSIIQAPTGMAHYNEDVWGDDEKKHPADEFWAERHVKYVEEEVADETGEVKMEKVALFEMRGRPSDFFPYGGGISVCPGRHLAKQEIILTLAMFATRFDVEFVDWTTLDGPKGKKSDRPPENNPNYLGAAGVPPDRDMKVRLKRLW
ncbi:Cytochrome P450 [Naviculisporaceae sp. PSN 640]